MVIVIQSPSLDFLLRIFDRKELIDVQTLVSQPAVERFYVAVIRWLSRTREVELDASLPCPFLERLGCKFRAVINRPGDRHGTLQKSAIESLRNPLSRHRESDLNQRTLATPASTTPLVDTITSPLNSFMACPPQCGSA